MGRNKAEPGWSFSACRIGGTVDQAADDPGFRCEAWGRPVFPRVGRTGSSLRVVSQLEVRPISSHMQTGQAGCEVLD